MSREDLLNHIVSEIRSPDAVDDAPLSDAVLCQKCGMEIPHNNNSDGEGMDDYVVHRVPEHGTEEMTSVFYCGRDCFQNAMGDLFDYADKTESTY